jgi:acyl-CoA synthetase (NDP forming)/GNAT superfamily N-acetyltransferase
MPLDAAEWPALQGSPPDRLVLRDGSVAVVRPTTAADRKAIAGFFHNLTAESRRKRFFVASEPSPDIVARLCDSTDPSRNLTLVALRRRDGELQPIAVASYAATEPATAEAAFAVADDLHGKGVATALLERLATIAYGQGLDRFEATTLADNREMLEVFRASGFEMRAKPLHGEVDVVLDLQPSRRGAAAIDERNRSATVRSLTPILKPRSIAVVGVSRDAANLGRRVHDVLLRAGFNGPVYAVNPHASDVGGRPAYASMREVPSGVDLAVIATPRGAVAGVVDDCASAGVRSLVVVSAGFAELDDEGRKLQRLVLEKSRAAGMRLVGPNCMGVIDTDPEVRLNASFVEQLPPPGRVAIASQSGGIGLALLELATVRHIGISSFVSLGNKADVSGNDLLQWGESDPRTAVLLLYLESFGNPRRFAQLARRIGRKKPIVVVKAGRTASGSRAAGSHTAGLATNDVAVDALFKQSGVIRADTIDEMFDVAQCLDLQPLPKGPRVAIVTNAGGPGILAADACEANSLVVAPCGGETQAALARGLSPNASVANPVDLIASAGVEAYEHAVFNALQAPEVDSLIVVYTPIDHAQTETMLDAIGRGVARARAAGTCDKPIVACTLSMTTQPPPLIAGSERVPAYMFPENAARALGHATAHSRWRAEPPPLFWTFDDIQAQKARTLCQSIVTARGDTWLTDAELKGLLGMFGLQMVAGAIARCEDEAAAVASRVGLPVVLKVQSPKILHKSEVGGVHVDLRTEQDVRSAFRDLAARFPDVLTSTDAGVQVQPMLRGVETIVGAADDPTFGPLVAFGLGGVDTEVLHDVAFRIVPLSEQDVDSLVHGIRSFPLLLGYRGRPAADLAALRELLLRVSLLAQRIPELRELDLNPVIVLPAGHGCRIVDARARVAES